jgi:nucleoid-associated protein YgaU
MSVILIDRRSAALLAREVAEVAEFAPARAAVAVRRAETRPATVVSSRPARSSGGITVRRAAGGGATLQRRLRCDRRPRPAAARRAPRRGAARTRTVSSPRPGLHLTRRGRFVALLLLFAVLTVTFSVGRVTSTALGAAGDGAPDVVVQRGDTLWSIAERIKPDADPRAVATDLMAVNGLGSPSLEVGQHLRLK